MSGSSETQRTAQTEDQTTEQPKTAEDYFGYDKETLGVLEQAVEDTGDAVENPQELINTTLKQVKVDDNGKFIYPEEIDPMLKAAVAATKSFRDTQSAYTRSQQQLKAREAELEAMREQLAKDSASLILTPEEQTELDNLKHHDPDRWYQVMQEIEVKGKEALQKKFGEVASKVEAEEVVQHRLTRLDDFNSSHDRKLTPEQLELEVPAKWVQEVVEGKLDFDDFLDRAYTFIYNEKVAANPTKPAKTTNINKVSGSSTPQKSEDQDDGIKYNEIVF
jgi:hypothetical protein